MVKNSYTKLEQYNRDTKKGTLKCPCNTKNVCDLH